MDVIEEEYVGTLIEHDGFESWKILSYSSGVSTDFYCLYCALV